MCKLYKKSLAIIIGAERGTRGGRERDERGVPLGKGAGESEPLFQ